MKNWLPLVPGPALAMASVPRGYRTGSRSLGSFGWYWSVGYSLANWYPGPPVPSPLGSPHCRTPSDSEVVSRWHLVLSKYFWPIRLAKLLTVQGDSLFASSSPRLPWLVALLALSWAGSVGTLPLRGGLTGLAAGSCDGGC